MSADLSSPEIFRIQPHTGVFAPNVDSAKLNQLAEDLETALFLEKQAAQP